MSTNGLELIKFIWKKVGEKQYKTELSTLEINKKVDQTICPHCHGHYNKKDMCPQSSTANLSQFVFECPHCLSKLIISKS